MTFANRNADALRFARPAQPDVASVFAHAVCIICLCLQRFGFPFAGGFLFLAVVAVPPLIAALLLTGRARIRSSTALVFMVMACCFLASAIGGVVAPDPRMRFSLFSIGELMVLYAFLMVEPAGKFDSRKVLRVFVFYVRLIAVMGILEYALQFAHIRVFSFDQMFPILHPFLAEYGFNVVAIIKWGSPILRSNGFFLLEPSLFSQVLVLGIVVDFFVLSRKLFLPVYAAALLSSYSGTGPLALVLTLMVMGVLSPGQIGRTVGLVAVGAVVMGVAALAFPAEFATLSGRASGSDASAQLRYTGQFEVIRTILNDPRIVFGFGPGAADGYTERVVGSMSPLLKLLFDYGALGVIVFVAFLVKAVWRSDKPILPVICLILFQVGGAALVFAPFLFVMSLLCIWSRPVAEAARPIRARLAPARRATERLPAVA